MSKITSSATPTKAGTTPTSTDNVMVSMESVSSETQRTFDKVKSRDPSQEKEPSTMFQQLKKGQNPEIKIRYTTKELIVIFKGLGRF